ncbi:MAG TPA: EAL domain-containing protein, partial [Sphingomonadaceae bacterium]|nr:EAL domain-containing protein [Sphingomonadaceae bacterium]
MEDTLFMVDRRSRNNDRRQPDEPKIAQDLEAAIAENAIELLLQPQFRCDDDRLVGAEALLRWNHPAEGLLAGDELFEIAMGVGLARRLSAWVRDAAMAAAAQWPDRLKLSLNVTADDLADPGFSASVAATLAATGFDPQRLTLEITEQALVDEVEHSARVLQHLSEGGISIALDDFGAGFCNFRYLKLLPLHYLKLDRSMVQGIAEDPRDLAVLRGITAMAHALGLSVIAEGIETQAQLELVAQEGCAFYQGFLKA